MSKKELLKRIEQLERDMAFLVTEIDQLKTQKYITFTPITYVLKDGKLISPVPDYPNSGTPIPPPPYIVTCSSEVKNEH